tara:strand:+ start:407 stop:1201 length:795 start_codon:yes stop_codon:yes gene_type:complete
MRFELSSADKILLANTDNGMFLVNSKDRVIGLNSYAKRQSWDFRKFEIVNKLLPRHNQKVLVDVGANIGSISISALINNYFTSAIAVEPEPNNFQLLKANRILNKLENKLKLHNFALGSVGKQSAYLSLNNINHGDHRLIIDKPHSGANIQVDVLTLDSILPNFEQNDSLIWIDVQGYEGFVLQGGEKAIKNLIPIVLEFSPDIPGGEENCAVIIDILNNSKYDTIVDLKTPNKILSLDKNTLDQLFRNLCHKNSFTDLFIFKK